MSDMTTLEKALFLLTQREKEIESLKSSVTALIEADKHVAERIQWVLGACTIDRDAKHELEEILSGVEQERDDDSVPLDHTARRFA